MDGFAIHSGPGEGGVNLLPSFTELWITETLRGTIWNLKLDGAGISAFGVTVDEGIPYWDLDTGILANDDAWISGKQRWMVCPSLMADPNFPAKKIVLEFMAKFTDVADSENQYTTIGFVEDNADNDNLGGAGKDIAAFTMKATDDINTITRVNGVETANDVTITPGDWVRYRIEVYQDGIRFYANQVLVATHTTNIPDQAMYLMFSTRAEGGAAPTGLQIGPIIVEYKRQK